MRISLLASLLLLCACAAPPAREGLERPPAPETSREPAALGRAPLVLGRDGPLADSTEPAMVRFRSFYGGNLPPRKETRACRALPENLRGLFYEHFIYYVDRHGRRIGPAEAKRFASLLARAWDGSRGNAANASDSRSNGNAISASRFVTDNLGREPRDSRAEASLESRAIILRSPRIHMDRRSRFGLLGSSAAELSDARARAALAEIQALALRNPDAAIDRCGSRWTYSDGERALKQALAEGARCRAGFSREGEVRCFAQWVTLCPNLSLSLALLKARDGGSRKFCAEAFESLITR